MTFTATVLAVALSISSTNDYVYTKPLGIALTGSASYGGSDEVRGEDAAFALEAMKERNAALGFVATNNAYDAATISADNHNEAQAAKSNALRRAQFAAFVKPDGELPDAFEVSADDPLGSVIEQVGGVVSSAGIDTSTVSNGSPVTAQSSANLGSGLGAFTRVAFRAQGTTDAKGYLSLTTGRYDGDADLAFDYETGEYSTGTLPPNPQPQGGETTGPQAKMCSYEISISGSKKTYQAWESEWGDYALTWGRKATATSGPMFYTGTVKYATKGDMQAFFPGNAARDSAQAEVVAAYAICDYHKSANGEASANRSVAVKMSATVDGLPYAGYVASGYAPRIVVGKVQAESVFSDVLSVLGEDEITTSAVAGKLGTPEVPQYAPPAPPTESGEFESNYNSSSQVETQGMEISGFVFVVDFTFNARTQ